LPGHIRDLGITQVTETHGRERRYKYFTFENYRKVAAREKLESPYPDGFFDAVGGFMPVEDDMFYASEGELNAYVDSYEKGTRKMRKSKAVARGTKRKRSGGEAEAGEGEGSSSMAPPAKKRRGRPPKVRVQPEPVISAAPMEDDSIPVAMQVPEGVSPVETPSAAKKRGRPQKHVKAVDIPTLPKKRGRPSKKKPAQTDVETLEEVTVPEDSLVDEAGPSSAPREPQEHALSVLHEGGTAEVASSVPEAEVLLRGELIDTVSVSIGDGVIGRPEHAVEATQQVLPPPAVTNGAEGLAEPLERDQVCACFHGLGHCIEYLLVGSICCC
jgi:oxalate---CoA ligase